MLVEGLETPLSSDTAMDTSGSVLGWGSRGDSL